MEKFELKSLTEFYEWKDKIERETCSSYTKQRGIVKKPNGEFLMYYNCNRSGKYTPSGKGFRRMKSKQSSKIGSKCSSIIRLKITDSGQRVIVKYLKVHDKHPPQVEHLRIPLTVRASIANKLMEGVSVRQIINALQEVSSDLNVNHLLLIKRKDILNIKRDFNVKKPIENQNYDTASLKLWAKDIVNKGPVNQMPTHGEESDCNGAKESLRHIRNKIVSTSSPNLLKPTFNEDIFCPVTKAQTFIELYQQNKDIIGEKDNSKIHELLNSLITIFSKNNNSNRSSDMLKIKCLEEEHSSLALSEKEKDVMYSSFNSRNNGEIGMNVTEELFELEEVFEESKFYEDMVNEDILELNENILDKVLNIHTEFDHSYF